MITLSYRTLVAFVAGVTLTILAGFAFQSWRADAWPGDFDTTFVPITSCRLADTRPAPTRVGPHGPFTADDTKTIQAHGTNGNCSIPTDATGLSLNVTAIGATAPTFLTIWPDGTRPEASSLNPVPGQPPTPNAVNTPLSGSGTFQIYNKQGSLNVIVDVNGFYTKTSLKDIDFWIGDLYLAQPFVETAYVTGGSLTGSPVLVTVTVTAPHDGKVTINSTAVFDGDGDTSEGERIACVIVESTNIPAAPIPESYESAQVLTLPSPWPSSGSVSGTRAFDITYDSTIEYVLACSSSPAGARYSSANLTAIFTPTY